MTRLASPPFVILAGLFVLAAALAGSLDPPGPPAPTMKPLDQVEPRIPITSLPFTISTPGSYYLTRSLSGAGNIAGITVNAAPATIDLMGYTLDGGQPANSSYGIIVQVQGRVVIKNGVISNWVRGVQQIVAGGGIECVLQDLKIANNSAGGAYANGDLLAVRTVFYFNGGDGLTAQGVAIVRDSRSGGNSGFGLNLQFVHSLVEDSTIDANSGGGIYVSSGSVVRHCVIDSNTGYGISIADRAFIAENSISQNTGDGVFVTGSGQGRIEGNNITSNGGYGINATTGGMFIVKNTARGNSKGNYNITGSNVAPIDTTGSSTNPWVNFSF